MKYVTLCSALVLGSAAPLAAATLAVDADAYIRGGQQSGSANGFSDELVSANNASDSGDFKTYLRFDLSGETEEIVDAELALTFAFVYGGTGSYEYEVWGLGNTLGDDWDEGSMNWGNAVGHNSADYQDMTGSTLLGTFDYNVGDVSAGEKLTFSSANFDTFINNGVGADGLATLIVLGKSGFHDIWASRENASYSGPGLAYSTVSTTTPPIGAVPLPAAAVLLLGGLGGLSFLWRRR